MRHLLVKVSPPIQAYRANQCGPGHFGWRFGARHAVQIGRSGQSVAPFRQITGYPILSPPPVGHDTTSNPRLSTAWCPSGIDNVQSQRAAAIRRRVAQADKRRPPPGNKHPTSRGGADNQRGSAQPRGGVIWPRRPTLAPPPLTLPPARTKFHRSTGRPGRNATPLPGHWDQLLRLVGQHYNALAKLPTVRDLPVAQRW